MTTYSKFNIIYRLQKWLDSVAGQTFMNYAYSWGASIVILGTLFKLTHLPGANFMLFLGMGTEVVVFFIAAFDRPFDKTTDGMELDIHMSDGDETPAAAPATVIAGAGPAAGGTIIGGAAGGATDRTIIGGATGGATDRDAEAAPIGGGIGGGTIIIGGSGGAIPGAVVGNGEEAARWEGGAPSTGAVSGAPSSGTVSGGFAAGTAGTAVPAATPLQPEQPMGEELKEATSNYIDELNRLTEMLAQVSEQSQRLTRDSEEMENLNRTLTGISRVYEMQLKSASAQIGTIDEINEQTRHMAEQIQELNRIYARMIEAMQVRTMLNEK